MRSRPDVLVLGAGGVLGEAWLSGVLAGVEDSTEIEFQRCDYFVGTSAGAIVAARLAAGTRLERPPAGPTGPATPAESHAGGGADGLRLLERSAQAAERAGTLALALGAPLVPLALSLAETPSAVARAAVLRAAPRRRETLGRLRDRIDEAGERFDGRLRVVAVARSSGRRVVFGRPGAPAARLGEAVEASCSVPWLFAPVRIGGAEYVDGGIWSPTNLDAAPAARGSFVLCLNPTAGLAGPDPLTQALRSASRSAMEIEATALRARGADVVLVSPDRASAAAIGTDLMDRGRRAAVLAAAYRQGLGLWPGGGGLPPPPSRLGAGLRAVRGTPAGAALTAASRLVTGR